MALVWQDSLFEEGGERLSFDGLCRLELDESCWLDLVPSWVPDHAELFDLLQTEAPWQQLERWMYDKLVLEPRLVAAWSGDDLALVVMGGRTQHDWQHTVPKERHAGARMSVTMRHSRPLPPVT